VLNIALVYVVLKNADEVDELKKDVAKLKRSTFAIFSQTPTLSENAPTECECPKCGKKNMKGTQKCCKCSTRYFSVDQ
ncbi:MAG: hypothetical protein IJZ80_00290, partial [Clostridia bacterium]|nr:hypothetical protein [Clostridia bacterium]